MKKKHLIIVSVVVLLIILVSSFSTILKFITDYLWFNEIGYVKTYLTKLKSELIIGIPFFILLFFVFFFYIKKVLKKNYEVSMIIEVAGSKKKANIWIFLCSLVISFMYTVSVIPNIWMKVLQFLNSKSLNITEPIFNLDLQFYLFKLPFINSVTDLFIEILLLMIGLSVVIILFKDFSKKIKDMSEQFGQSTQNISFNKLKNKSTLNKIINQISVLGMLLLIAFGIKIYLNSFNLLYSDRGRVFGAGFTDVAITLNVYRIMAIVCIASSITFLIGAKKKNMKIALALPVLVIGISILGSVTSGVVEKFIVEPDQLSKESKYLANNIKYTQMAYGIDDVEQLDFDVQDNLTKEDLANNKDVIDNIRINDKAPLKQVYNKLQGIRPYYSFNDVDIDRYIIDGKYRQVYLSARELDQSLLNTQAKTWINEYLKYTHGYGITLSLVNQVTSQGQPELLIKDIPPTTSTTLTIERPEIYFGEKTNSYIIVNTDEKEFDYPLGSDNVESLYEGDAGIKLNFINKLLFAIREGSYKLLISSNINSNSKIIINRNIIDRVKEIAPFLIFDEDPYIVVNEDDGKLYWIIDGFTYSDKYPYSEPYGDTNINYIRNSVKIVVDAYNGDTNFYIVDEEDPIIMTYNEIFKDLFKSIDEMPQGIKSHIRYSQEMMKIQAQMYRTYHMENTTVFFGREDNWDIAKQKYMSSEQEVEPNYYIFKLPNEEKVEFLLTIPYTPQGKDNMSAMLVARNDGDNYGQLLLYKFPKNKNIQGTALIESKIDQDTEISSQLTLWSQKGSNVLRGDTLIIPIENSLLYIEPIYLQSDTQSNFPEMKMVVAAYNNNIVMESTLDKALEKVFGSIYTEDKDESNNNDLVNDNIDEQINDVQTLIQQANNLLNEANEALKNGDWALYGEKQESLKTVLSKLNNLVNDTTEINNSNDIEENSENVEQNNESSNSDEGNE